jgi:tetratricopeptide (TPR) repeat protein
LGLCLAYNGTGAYVRIAEIAPELLERIRGQNRESELYARGLNVYSALGAFCGHGMAHMGDFEQGLALCKAALGNAALSDDTRTLAFCEMLYGSTFGWRGDAGHALELCERSIKHSEEGRFSLVLALAWTLSGFACQLSGELEKARERMTRGLAVQENGRIEYQLSLHLAFLSWCHGELGELSEARAFGERGLTLSQRQHERIVEAHSWVWLGRAMAKADASDAARGREYVQRGIALASELRCKCDRALFTYYLAKLHADSGRGEEALKCARDAEAWFHEMGAEYWLEKVREVRGGWT